MSDLEISIFIFAVLIINSYRFYIILPLTLYNLQIDIIQEKSHSDIRRVYNISLVDSVNISIEPLVQRII